MAQQKLFIVIAVNGLGNGNDARVCSTLKIARKQATEYRENYGGAFDQIQRDCWTDSDCNVVRIKRTSLRIA